MKSTPPNGNPALNSSIPANTTQATGQGARRGKQISGFALLASVTLVAALTGCIGYVDGPRPVVQVEPAIVVQDDYVYYPEYQVYYSSNRRQYIYLEGRSWVARPAPPRVSAEVLFAGPSVRLGFHDSPALHHSAVVRQYPKHWAPPGSNHRNHGRN